MSSPASSSDYVPGGKPLTGRKVLLIFVAFFGVIFAMNFFLVKIAATTFRGLETASSYQRSQTFNAELAAVAAQRSRGWAVEAHVGRGADGVVHATYTVRDAAGAPVAGLVGTARLAAPANAQLDASGSVVETAYGTYEVVFAGDPAPGRWDLVTVLEQDGIPVFRSRNRILVD